MLIAIKDKIKHERLDIDSHAGDFVALNIGGNNVDFIV